MNKRLGGFERRGREGRLREKKGRKRKIQTHLSIQQKVRLQGENKENGW